MPPTTVAVDYRHLHRFPEQDPEPVKTVKVCSQGHDHLVRAAVYYCECGFTLTLPLEKML